MSTTDRAAAIRARLTAATPGPWLLNPAHAYYGVMVHNDVNVVAELSSKHQTYEEQVGNGSLIANAPADLTWLLDQLEATQARAAAAEARLERAKLELDALVPCSGDCQGLFRHSALVDHAGELYCVGCVSTARMVSPANPAPRAIFGAWFPQTPEHDAVTDQAAARLLTDD